MKKHQSLKSKKSKSRVKTVYIMSNDYPLGGRSLYKFSESKVYYGQFQTPEDPHPLAFASAASFALRSPQLEMKHG